jgi:hypothetical protein
MIARLRLALAILASGAAWSVSYLLVLTVLEVAGVSHALILAWVLKIAWSAAHTAVSRARGLAAVAAARCTTCCTC